MKATQFHVEPEWYRSRERAEQEWRNVWCKAWHMGPRSDELAEPGDVFKHGLGAESLLFVRQDDGSLAGFFNVCRHRGNRLLLGSDGPAFVNKFNCAFHGWCYDRAGNLTDVPYRERFDEQVLASPEQSALARFRVDTFAGWVWFSLDDDAPPLREYLGAIGDRLESYHMERATIVDYKTFEFDCNWKTVHDAFNESYHFQSLHSDILSWGNEDALITLLGLHSYMVNEYGRPSSLHSDQETINPSLAMLLEANGIDPATFAGSARDVRAAVQQAKRSRQGTGPYPYEHLTDSQLSDAYHYLVFPSTHFNLFPEFYVALRYRLHPSLDPQKMYFDFIMCAPLEKGETVAEYEHRVVRGGSEPVGDVLNWGARAHPVVNQVLGEDVELVEHVQAGVASQSFGGPILSEDERRIAHFHENIDAMIKGASLQDLMASNAYEEDAQA